MKRKPRDLPLPTCRNILETFRSYSSSKPMFRHSGFCMVTRLDRGHLNVTTPYSSFGRFLPHTNGY